MISPINIIFCYFLSLESIIKDAAEFKFCDWGWLMLNKIKEGCRFWHRSNFLPFRLEDELKKLEAKRSQYLEKNERQKQVFVNEIASLKSIIESSEVNSLPVWLRNRLISAGLELVMSHSKKSYRIIYNFVRKKTVILILVLIARAFSALRLIKMELILIFIHFNILWKLSIIQYDK